MQKVVLCHIDERNPNRGAIAIFRMGAFLASGGGWKPDKLMHKHISRCSCSDLIFIATRSLSAVKQNLNLLPILVPLGAKTAMDTASTENLPHRD